jgi:hypothetical protein
MAQQSLDAVEEVAIQTSNILPSMDNRGGLQRYHEVRRQLVAWQRL